MAKYHVQIDRFGRCWNSIPFAEGQLQYCNGYVDAIDSMYPSAPCRIVRTDTGTVVRETPGRSAVHTNNG